MGVKLINIGEDFTPEGLKQLKIGQLLRFQGDKGIREFRIVTMNKKQKTVMVREVTTYLDSEMDIVDK